MADPLTPPPHPEVRDTLRHTCEAIVGIGRDQIEEAGRLMGGARADREAAPPSDARWTDADIERFRRAFWDSVSLERDAGHTARVARHWHAGLAAADILARAERGFSPVPVRGGAALGVGRGPVGRREVHAPAAPPESET